MGARREQNDVECYVESKNLREYRERMQSLEQL